MKKIIISFIVIFLVTSCTKNLTDLNKDPKNPTAVTSTSLFTNAQRTLATTMSSTNVNLNIFRLITQYWQETTYTDESNYDIITRTIHDRLWTAMYRDILINFKTARSIIPSEVSDPVQQKNMIAITDIMEVYTWYYIVTTFGNVPYTEALNIKNTFPKYDDQATIYSNLLTRLDADIANLNAAGGSFGAADIVYGGDAASWKLFANSFKLKMGMTIADADNAKAKTTVESAVAAGVFSSNADNAMFSFLASPPNTNQAWVDLVQSGRLDFVAASTITNKMVSLNDPRLPYYFTFNSTGGYSGGAPGASSNWSTFSKPGGLTRILLGDPTDIGHVADPDAPYTLLSYAEVEFYLAEAKERGYTVPGTAATHYNNAITASILEWGGTSAQAITYLAQPSVNYLTAAGTYKQKIGEQKWIALYNRGWDAWIEVRRLDFPALVAPSTAVTAFPVRFRYPINESNVNTVNFNAAGTAIGGDQVTTKLFWDKF
jgi:hypothetical protein